MKRLKSDKNWTGYTDKNGVLIMKGDKVKQEGIRGGYYNNQDRIITLSKGRFVDSINNNLLFEMGYYSRGNEVII